MTWTLRVCSRDLRVAVTGAATSARTCHISIGRVYAFEARTGTELAGAYDQIRDSLGETLGEEIEIVKELTWRWALGSFVLLAAAWALSLWWLRGMV